MAAAYGKESGIREKIMELKDYEEVVAVCDIQEKCSGQSISVIRIC